METINLRHLRNPCFHLSRCAAARVAACVARFCKITLRIIVRFGYGVSGQFVCASATTHKPIRNLLSKVAKKFRQNAERLSLKARMIAHDYPVNAYTLHEYLNFT